MESDIFGDFFLPSDLISSANALLEKYFPLYIKKMEQRTGLKSGTLKAPTNYAQRTSFSLVPGETLPKVIVLIPGLIGAPLKNGRGVYRATWRMGVGVAVVGNSEMEAYLHSTLYGAIIRMIFVHHPGILGASQNTTFIDESYDELPTASESQKFRGASVWFAVDVDNVVQVARGPQDPEVIYGIAQTVKVDIERDGI